MKKKKLKEKRTQIFVWRVKLKRKLTPAKNKKIEDQIEKNNTK
jgi:hypothetical protein